MDNKQIYHFGDGGAEGTGKMKQLLGGKGAGLAEMASLGVPVPPGFTITTEVCAHFTRTNGQYPDGLEEGVRAHVARLETQLGRLFGSQSDPLLFSVRSGAPVSMPGMMDTILNLGLNAQTVEGLATSSGDPRFAWDSYRRFIQMYGDVVLEVPRQSMEVMIDEVKARRGVSRDTDLTADDWRELAGRFKDRVAQVTGHPFPQDVWEQLWGAVKAVFHSWNNQRAIDYRKIYKISADLGTAVNVQCMVFGNRGETSATGVAFTRDPNTGSRRFFGEYLINAQGEDVVAGIRTPGPVAKVEGETDLSLEERMPTVYSELCEIYQRLEQHYRDMLDLEFTIEQGHLWMLQVRTGKRTARASVHIAVDMVEEGLIDWNTAIGRVSAEQVEQLLHPTLDSSHKAAAIARGLPASPGAVSGIVIFDPAKAVDLGEKGEAVILVRPETSPEDVMAMKMSRGILTTTGGMTSHAAVVGRGMGKTCVVGCSALQIDEHAGTFRVGDVVVKEGDVITLDGATGSVYLGKLKTRAGDINDAWLGRLLTQADRVARLQVWANADTPDDATIAREFGAQGIGLCRTEHMFFAKERIGYVRQMILSEHAPDLQTALDKLEEFQTEDFLGILAAMQGLPVTVRLLDPPLHEFLPRSDADMEELALSMAMSVEQVRSRSAELHEQNPMLGHRGCRLGITHPAIYRMQVRALMRAAVSLYRRGLDVHPEIMIPLIASEKELAFLRQQCEEVATEVFTREGCEVPYTIGTMIELPRAALTADEVARSADFFSFGTNDLTQTTFGLSRDDMSRFIFSYYERGIWAEDPFKTLDVGGVGQLVRMGVEKGRATRPGLKVGICGEHGGDPASIKFCSGVGLNYVSCSPFRVPVARLAAAHAALV